MAIFKIYESDFSFTFNNKVYTFTEVENMTIEDNERTRLIRGANASNTTGIAYKEGVKEAKVITLTVIGMPKDVHDLLKKIYDKAERVEVSCISRTDGSSKIAKNAILSQSPKQLSIDEGAESMNTALIFESFDVSEVHKS